MPFLALSNQGMPKIGIRLGRAVQCNYRNWCVCLARWAARLSVMRQAGAAAVLMALPPAAPQKGRTAVASINLLSPPVECSTARRKGLTEFLPDNANIPANISLVLCSITVNTTGLVSTNELWTILPIALHWNTEMEYTFLCSEDEDVYWLYIQTG